jgi:hypothetical protein
MVPGLSWWSACAIMATSGCASLSAAPGFATRTGRGYSIGINIRKGTDFFHFGDFMWSNPRTSYGAYYAMWHQGVRFVVTYTPDIDHGLVDELDAALYRAAFQ